MEHYARGQGHLGGTAAEVDRPRGSRHGSGAKARRAASRLVSTSSSSTAASPVTTQVEPVTTRFRQHGAWADLSESKPEHGFFPGIADFPIVLPVHITQEISTQVPLVVQHPVASSTEPPCFPAEFPPPDVEASVPFVNAKVQIQDTIADVPVHITQEKNNPQVPSLVQQPVASSPEPRRECGTVARSSIYVQVNLRTPEVDAKASLGDFFAAQYLANSEGQVNSFEDAQQLALDGSRQLRQCLLRQVRQVPALDSMDQCSVRKGSPSPSRSRNSFSSGCVCKGALLVEGSSHELPQFEGGRLVSSHAASYHCFFCLRPLRLKL